MFSGGGVMTPPLTFELYSSKESLAFQSFDKQRKVYLYKYTVSETKLGLVTPYTEEWLVQLLAIQELFKPVGFFDLNFEL